MRRAVGRLGTVSADGIPLLTPEVRSFSKAARPRPEDEEDFAAVRPVLEGVQRHRLARAVDTAYGLGPWSDRLPG